MATYQWWQTDFGQHIIDLCVRSFGENLPDPSDFTEPLAFYTWIVGNFTSDQLQSISTETRKLIHDLAARFDASASLNAHDKQLIDNAYQTLDQKVNHTLALANESKQKLLHQIKSQEEAVNLKLSSLSSKTTLSQEDMKFQMQLLTEKMSNISDTIFALKTQLDRFEFQLNSQINDPSRLF